MNKIKSLLIISNGYPTKTRPLNSFVEQLVNKFSDNGIRCVVISPISISKHIIRKIELAKYESEYKTDSGNTIKVYRPRYISFSNSIFNISTAYLTYHGFKKCVLKECKKINMDFDAIYGHFIYPAGMSAVEIGEIYKKPSFIAYGECSPDEYSCIDKRVIKETLDKADGIISVSTKNMQELINSNLVSAKDKIGVFPNGIDNNRFYKIDKGFARKQLGLDDNIFIVVFVGLFIERKGIHNLSAALDSFDDVYSIFIGEGPEEPKCKNILFQGTVPHDKIYLYLNAADAFVLPTQAEGCCNAIIEAMACGLPIISSDKPFNDDILNDRNSIRVDEEDVEAIKNAILRLKEDNKIRKNMADEAIISASELSIQKRAQKIIEFINSKI